MKYNIIKRLGTFIIILIFCTVTLQANEIIVKTGNTDLKIKENSYSKLQISNSFTKLTYNYIKTGKGYYTKLLIPEYGVSNNIGSPELPVLKRLIEIPFGANVNIIVKSYNISEYKLSDYGIFYKLFPSQPSVSKDTSMPLPEFQYNNLVYSTDNFNTDELVSVEILGEMRGIRLARLNIAPVRYNPISNSIKIYNDLEVEITFPGADITQTIEKKENKSSLFFESMFNKLLFNYKINQAKDTITNYPVKYVIVSDPSFQTALQPFIQWKTKKGFTVIEAYTNNPSVGTTTTSIKNYLKGLYNAGTPINPAPTFVLFVGDVGQIPSFNGNTGSHVSDLKYCEYTGDYFPEIYYGRFSATNISQLQPQIDKTLEYEQYLMPDPSFLDKVVMIAGQDATHGPLQGDGQINYGTSTYFNTSNGLTSYTYLHAVSGSSSSAIIQNVSSGAGFVNYTAHGSSSGWYNPSFLVSDIAGLQNVHKYPLMVGNCCLTNTFNNTECFGEALLRANNKGALGYIGGSNNTYWDEDYWWGVGYKTVIVNPVYNANNLGAYDRTFHNHGENFGEWYASQSQMIYAGNLAVTQSGSNRTNYYWEVYHLMGDPSLMVYYGVPPALTAIYQPSVLIGTTMFSVITEPYAYVAVSMSGVLHGAALADSTGVAAIPISTLNSAGIANIVVTKQNREPFIDTINVIVPTGPYIIYNNNLLHDAAGNNNGKADYGESITLDIVLKNIGITVDSGVSAKLNTTDTYITITDSTQTWGNIINGNTSTQINAYAFTVDSLIPDQHIALFTLIITDTSGNTWTGTFNIILNAPVLTIGNIVIYDSSGNNNGHIDPGETANIVITSSNTGHANTVNTISTLTSSNSNITINTGITNLGILNALGGTANSIFNVSVSSSATIGSIANFTNILTDGLYTDQKNINLMIGIIDEDWETGTFTKFQWIQGTHPWTITNTAPYEGIYCANSGIISDEDSSTLKIILNVLTDDSISFYNKVSSEDSYDFLNFYIDSIKIGSWSGTTAGWTRVAFLVTAGLHTFQWSYEKDNSYSSGSDCAWIDDILFPPVQLPVGVVNDFSNNANNLFCYPNPSNNTVIISYNLNKEENVSVKIYNSTGQEIAVIVNGEKKQAGFYSVPLNIKDFYSGIYYCVFETNNNITVKKLMITKQ